MEAAAVCACAIWLPKAPMVIKQKLNNLNIFWLILKRFNF
jgi:hypothetical protein